MEFSPINFFLITIVFFFSITSFSQGIERNEEYKNSISLMPTEVISSVIISMKFDEVKQIKYTIIKDNSIVLSKSINKAEGELITKADFSELDKGAYVIIFYIDNEEGRRIEFIKK